MLLIKRRRLCLSVLNLNLFKFLTSHSLSPLPFSLSLPSLIQIFINSNFVQVTVFGEKDINIASFYGFLTISRTPDINAL